MDEYGCKGQNFVLKWKVNSSTDWLSYAMLYAVCKTRSFIAQSRVWMTHKLILTYAYSHKRMKNFRGIQCAFCNCYKRKCSQWAIKLILIASGKRIIKPDMNCSLSWLKNILPLNLWSYNRKSSWIGKYL